MFRSTEKNAHIFSVVENIANIKLHTQAEAVQPMPNFIGWQEARV